MSSLLSLLGDSFIVEFVLLQKKYMYILFGIKFITINRKIPTTIPIKIDALSPEGDSVGNEVGDNVGNEVGDSVDNVVGDSVGNEVGEGDSVGSNEYSQLQGIEEESLELNHSPL